MTHHETAERVEFNTDLELGYYAAFEITTFCEKHGYGLSLKGKRLVYDKSAMPRDLRDHIKSYAEHIKLFIMNAGAPPPGIALVCRDSASKRAREYAKTRT